MKSVILLIVTLSVFAPSIVYAQLSSPHRQVPPRLLETILEHVAWLQLRTAGAAQSTYYWLWDEESFGHRSYMSVQEEFKSLEDAGSRDKAIEHLFASLETAKIIELAKTYEVELVRRNEIFNADCSMRWLYDRLKRGQTDVGDRLMEIGLDLKEADLQVLLFDALRPFEPKRAQGISTSWQEWLFAHGATVSDPQLIEMLFKRAALSDKVGLLGRLESRFAKDFTAETHAQLLNSSLDAAVRGAAHNAATWLRGRGADARTLTNKNLLLQIALLRYLEETSDLSKPLAHYISHIDAELLNPVLHDVFDVVMKEGTLDLLDVLDRLLALGAKFTEQELQAMLHKTLQQGKFGLAIRLMAHGAKVNELNLNTLIREFIEEFRLPNNRHRLSAGSAALFEFLAMFGVDRRSMGMQQLLSEADEEVSTQTLHSYLYQDSLPMPTFEIKAAPTAPMSIPPTELLPILRLQNHPPLSVLGKTPTQLLQDAIGDLQPYEMSRVWLSLYLEAGGNGEAVLSQY